MTSFLPFFKPQNKVGIMSRPTFNEIMDDDFDKSVKSPNDSQKINKKEQLKKIVNHYIELDDYDRDNNHQSATIPIFYDEDNSPPYLVEEEHLVLNRNTVLSDKYMNGLIEGINKYKPENDKDIRKSITQFQTLQTLLQNIYGNDLQNGGKIRRHTIRKKKKKNHRKTNRKSRKKGKPKQ